MRLIGIVAPIALGFALVATIAPTAAAQSEAEGSGASVTTLARSESGPAQGTRSRFVDADGLGDRELFEALDAAGMLDAWLDAGPSAPELAFLAVDGDVRYDDERQSLLVELEALAVQGAVSQDRAARIERLALWIDDLAFLARDMRRGVRTDLSGRGPIEATLSVQVLADLDRMGESLTIRPSLDPLVQLESRLAITVVGLSRALGAGRTGQDETQKGSSSIVSAASAISNQLDELRRLVALAATRQTLVASRLDVTRAALVDRLPDLHSQRLLAVTEIEGLPLGTLDAYVRAGHATTQRCGIDWTLLAGIGAVESFHGTIGDSEVGPSGRVSPPILGPLLDGGATVAEAAEAARVAAREAHAAAEAEAEAEAEAAAGAEAAAEPRFSTDLWGEPTPTPERVPPPRPDQFDPRLWGEATPSDDTNAATGADRDGGEESDEESDEDSDDEEADEDDDAPIRARGNGFAVIRDSDRGRLDGNSRWDRAVGPMQFLPETWSRFETDGNGDGVADPQNLYDAAATAGIFLCWLKSHRGNDARTFVLGYNSSDTYVSNVLQVAARFASAAVPVVDHGA